MATPIEEIKDKIDIAELVSGYVTLQKAGANFRGLCPFHSEKSPSFFVSPARQMWRCFGCSLGGDVFEFVKQIEGVEFGDALRVLAQRTGVELPARDPNYARAETERKRILDIIEWATKFFETQLSGPAGEQAKKYLLERKISEQSLAKWRVGYAPDTASSLFSFLKEKGFTEQEIGKAGLLVRSEGKTYDRFRSRIIFPITDLNGQVIGFGGRIFGKDDKELAKYLNTASTPVYDKSRIMYGLDSGKMSIRKHDMAIVVEGYTDVILTNQAGFENIVAPCGTALTSSHLKILRRYTDNLLLAFDMDEAGGGATKRSIDLAIEEGFNVKVIIMSEGKDPADVASSDPREWEKLVEGAVSIFDFYFTTAFAKHDKTTPEGKKNIASDLLPVIKKIVNSIEQAHWIQKLANELEVKEQIVLDELAKVKEDRITNIRANSNTVAEPVRKDRQGLLEERVLFLLFADPKNIQLIPEEGLAYFSPNMQNMIEGMKRNPKLDVAAWEGIFPAETVDLFQSLALRAEVEQEDEHDWEGEFRICMQELRAIAIKRKLEDIGQAIHVAEQNKDSSKVQALMTEFEEVTKKLI